MSRIFVLAALLCASVAVSPAIGVAETPTSIKGNKACWTSDPGDSERSEITCRDLSEHNLAWLENRTPQEVTWFFGVPGKDHKPNHFEGMDNSTGQHSGNVDLVYTKGHVSAIEALVAQARSDGSASDMFRFAWNPAKKLACSDFPDSKTPCPDE